MMPTAARLSTAMNGTSELSIVNMDPNKIVIRNSKTGAVDFTCGPQKPQAVLVEYESKANPQMGTIGEIQAIEFK